MHILVLDITSPSGNYHKSLPISEQAASDPARRGNLIREAVAHYPGGKAAGWKVVDGDRILAQSTMKTAISQTVPGVADRIHDRAHFGEVIAELNEGPGSFYEQNGGRHKNMDAERDYHDDNEREAAEADPFEIPKAEDPIRIPGMKISHTDPNFTGQRISNRQEAFQIGVEHATAALETNSVLADFQTPFGDGGNGMDTSLRDAYEGGYNSVINYCLTDDQRAKLHGYDSIVVAEHDARALTMEFEKPVWAVDRGSNVRPRYATFEGYKVGDYVSKGFNGDIYPLGRIIGLGGQGDQVIGWRIIVVETPEGREIKFWRRKTSDSWKEGGVEGTFGLVRGLHNARNPSF